MTAAHRTARIALIALSLAAAPPVAVAQEPGQDTEQPARDDAEAAFLRAYYLELGEGDPSAALASYREVAASHPGTAAAAKARLRTAHCLVALGRLEEARSVLAAVLDDAANDETRAAAAVRLLDEIGTRSGEDELTPLVLRALREEAWLQKTPEFGAPAVPVLTRLLRSADPEIVGRAAASLRRIDTDSAWDGLLAALGADDVRYRDKVLEVGLATGPFPDRFGARVGELDDPDVRRRLVRSAMLTGHAQRWLLDLVLAEDWARKVAFPDRYSTWQGIGWLTERVVAAGPGPARDAALAHLRVYEPDAPKRSWSFKSPQPLAAASAEFLQDREAVRVVARHVLCDFRGRPSAALRDALLADPDTRALALGWTWQHRIPCMDRALLVEALSGDWNFEARRAASIVSDVLTASFDPPPTGAEWKRILPNCPVSVWTLMHAFAEHAELSPAALDALLEAGQAREVLLWIVREGVSDWRWIGRVVPPLLRSSDHEVAVLAAQTLGRLHAEGKLDASPHARTMAALMRHDGFFGEEWAVNALLAHMGDAGRRAVIEAMPLGTRGDYLLLERMTDGAVPGAGELARRLMTVSMEEDDAERAQMVDDAARSLLRLEGDAAIPDVVAAIRLGPQIRARSIASEPWSSPHLTPEGLEAFVSALLDDPPEGLRFPTHSGRLRTDAVQRLSLRALGTDAPDLQLWGALRQATVLDPAAVGRLGELAESSDSRVRAAARAALTALREADEDMAWMRAAAARRATRARIDVLLASEDATQRKAGVAGLVALRAPDAIDRLLEVAASDPDRAVRIEARRALLALGSRSGVVPPEDE